MISTHCYCIMGSVRSPAAPRAWNPQQLKRECSCPTSGGLQLWSVSSLFSSVKLVMAFTPCLLIRTYEHLWALYEKLNNRCWILNVRLHGYGIVLKYGKKNRHVWNPFLALIWKTLKRDFVEKNISRQQSYRERNFERRKASSPFFNGIQSEDW